MEKNNLFVIFAVNHSIEKMNSKKTCIRITSQWIKTCMSVQHVDTHSKLSAKWEIMHELHIHSLFHHVKCVQKHFKLKVIWTDTWNYMQVILQNVTTVIKSWKGPRITLTKCNIPKDKRERKFECIICRWKFLNKRYLKEHLKYKHGPKQYKCKKCKKEFSYRKAFNDHKKICCN
jgi:hypothetical protein